MANAQDARSCFFLLPIPTLSCSAQQQRTAISFLPSHLCREFPDWLGCSCALMDPGLLQPTQPPHANSMIIHATSPQIEFSRATRLRAPGMILVAQRHAAYGMMQATGHDGHLCPVVAGRKIVDHLLRGWKYTSCSLSRPSSGAFLRRSSISRCSLPRHSVHTRSTRFLSLLLRGALFLMFARQLLMLFTICQDIGLGGNENKLQQRARENLQIVFPAIFYNLTILMTSLATQYPV